MAWVVDTCILIDVLEDDPSFGESSARLLDHHAREGLVVCPVTYAELAPSFDGDLELQDVFLTGVGVRFREDWTFADTRSAHAAWGRHIRRKRKKQAAKRPLADILIGAFAERFSGLLTRNADDFSPSFPALRIRSSQSVDHR